MGLKSFEEMLNFLSEKIREFQEADFQSFREHVDAEKWRALPSPLLDQAGVYIIYEEGEVIYVGATQRKGRTIRDRINDLFYKPTPGRRFKHTLTSKLINKLQRFRKVEDVRNYFLKKCKFKVIGTKTSRDAKLLEAVLIYLLNPKYNIR